jgi:chromosome segregation ATPase
MNILRRLRTLLQIVLLLGLGFLTLFLVVEFTDLLEWKDLNPFAESQTAVAQRDQPAALVEMQSIENENARLAALAQELEARERRLDSKERRLQLHENKLIARLSELEKRAGNQELQLANQRSRQDRLEMLADYVGASRPKAAVLQLGALETQDVIEVLSILDERAEAEDRISPASLLISEMLQPSLNADGETGFTDEDTTALRSKAEDVLRALGRYEREKTLEIAANGA